MVTAQHPRVQDPVCSMDINPKSAHPVYEYKGRTYYFCAENCRSAFSKNPEKYLKPKGFFGRFLDRMVQSNKKAFGCKGPSCH
ncbi:YHS domain-containing protein [Thermodesulfobacteriota bacterium]